MEKTPKSASEIIQELTQRNFLTSVPYKLEREIYHTKTGIPLIYNVFIFSENQLFLESVKYQNKIIVQNYGTLNYNELTDPEKINLSNILMDPYFFPSLTIEEYILPLRWACYLINGDITGITYEEIVKISDFLKSKSTEKDYIFCINCDCPTWFTRCKDADSLNTETITYYFVRDYKR